MALYVATAVSVAKKMSSDCVIDIAVLPSIQHQGLSLILLTLPGNRLPVRESHCPAFFISNVQGECVMTNRQTNPEKPKYFDLDINGIGYLNRAREVTPENGIPFLSVTIAALARAC